ncbi:MAG: T9SS type A sorting domain-containing protein [candidate division Zixibacteria bacterium]|nr:T9SS type A sorting domain-containing protein [candidate division Zixibacteria bacterium]
MSKFVFRTVLYLFVLTMVMQTAAAFAAEELPIWLTEEEKTRLHEIGMYHTVTSPPSGSIRNCAEWEPSEGVIIRYPFGISYTIIAEMSEDVMVTTICSSQSQEDYIRSQYQSHNVNMDNVQFIHAPTDTYWTRDYGPWFIFSDEDIGIVDHIYNRPRPNDDQIPWEIGDEWNIPVYGMDLEHTGGNHMSDGLGMSMSTELVYNENPDKTPAEIDAIMYQYLGNDYTVLDYVEYWGIHHIDCWAKFLSPATILVKDVPQSDPSYDELNDRAEQLSQQMSAWGRPYNVVRVYCPSGTAYTNSLILNDKVLVPIFNNSWDDEAIETYQNAMPGYEVLGFTGSWLDNDALHCRAMGVPDVEMLHIAHVPLPDEVPAGESYEIAALIQDCSYAGLINDSLKVYYSVNGGVWNSVPMTVGGDPDSFYGYIPEQPAGSRIAYYLKAADYSGRVETHPYIGQPGAHQVVVSGLLCGDIDMVPDDYPINVPPGGSFGLTGFIGNPNDEAITIDVWVGVAYQSTFYQLWNFPNISLSPGQYVNSHLIQSVPGYAPSGTYDYVSYCGDKPVKCDSASFEFTVTGNAVPGGADEWLLDGEWGAGSTLPSEVAVIGNYPNPFNATTTIRFELPESGRVNLEVYNIAGQRIATLANRNMSAGEHSIKWDASENPSGVYFYKLSIGDKVFSSRMTLVK